MTTESHNIKSLADGPLLHDFAKAGSQEAFAVLVRRHGGLVLGVCRRVLGDSHGAEDAAQAVFLTLAQKAGMLSGRESVAGWLQRVSWYVACRAREAAVVRRKHEQEAAAMGPHEQSSADTADLGPILDEELGALPEKYRLSLVLHHLEGRTVQEAAGIMQAKVGTTAGWVSRGRELLRQRLARRGVAVSAGALAASLAIHGVQTVSASFVASTAQAATLVAAGEAAAGGVISTQSAVLFKETVKMMFLSKVKVAAMLMVAASIPVAVGVATYQIMATPAVGQVTIQPAAPAGKTAVLPAPIENIAWPKKVSEVDYAKLQAAALAKKMDVSYRRATPSEVIADLEARSAVRVAFAPSLAEGSTFTLDGKGLSVKEVIEKLSGELKCDLEFRPVAAVVTQKADDGKIAALGKQIADADRWERCQAAWALGNLADPRIYPMLIQALSDKDVGVADWALKSLTNHARMALLWTDAQKDTVSGAVSAWIQTLEKKDSQTLEFEYGNVGTGMMRVWMAGPRPLARQARLGLLAATGRPHAIHELAAIVAKEPHPILRRWAATALADNRVGASELADVLGTIDTEVAEAKAKSDAIMEDHRKNQKPGEPLVLGSDSPLWAANVTLRDKQMVRHDIIVALQSMRVPEFIETVQGLIGKDQRSLVDTDLMFSAIRNVPDAFDVTAEMQRAIKAIAPLYGLKEASRPATGDFAFDTPVPEAVNAANTLRTVVGIADPALTAEFTKLVKNDQAYEALSVAVTHEPAFVLPANDPDLVMALITRVNQAGGYPQMAFRTLATSHSPAVADALIALLKDKDPVRAADAGVALAGTRDPRALPLLVALVKEKRNWPDIEEEDRITLASGGAVRPRPNPRKALVAALLETRDPKAFTELASLATDATNSKEAGEAARRRLSAAVASPEDLERFFNVVEHADVPSQQEIMGGTITTAWSGFGVTGVKAPAWRVARDARWIKNLIPGVDDPDSYRMSRSRGKMVPRGNYVVDAISAIKSPAAEKTLVDLSKSASEHVAYFAARALETFRDPKIQVQYQR